MHEGDQGAGAIEPRIGARGLDRDPVNVARDNAGAEGFRRRDRQHARSGAEVEHPGSSPPLCQVVERQQTAARGAVVAGAESERGFDFDADVVGLDAGAVVRAVHDEAAGAHRFEAGEAFLDPIGRRDRFDGKRGRRCFSRRECDQRAQARFVGPLTEMHRQLPLAAVILESGAGGRFRVEAFAQIGREPPGGRLVAGETGDGGSHGRHLQRLVKPLAMAM